ncbi:MAG: hypothetical protein WEE89_21195, partial [Gemmatimonadota bacterium]
MKNHTFFRRQAWLAALLLVPSIARAQGDSTRTASVGPPIQRISTASALSTEQLGVITSVRELPNGNVLVNDGTRRRLLLMDTTLKLVNVVLDSLSEVSNTYGTRPGALIPFSGDSTLFVDPASYAMVVLDPDGKMVRVRSVWRVEDVFYLTSTTFYGVPGVDSKGRIVYRIRAQPAPPLTRPPAGMPWFPTQPDSAFVVAVNLETRRLDTLGVIRTPKEEMEVRQSPTGGWSISSVFNPLPASDDWALLADSRVAFVRWRDYSIDYLNPDGTKTSSGKLPYDWVRLTDEDKERMVDSVKTMLTRNSLNSYVSNMIRWVNMYGKDFPANFKVHEGYVPNPGMPKDWIMPPGVTFPPNYMYACAPGQEPPSPAAMQAAMLQAMTAAGAAPPTRGDVPPPAGGATPPPAGGAARPAACFPAPVMMTGGVVPQPPTLRLPSIMSWLDLPDYKPPITTGAVRAEVQGN